MKEQDAAHSLIKNEFYWIKIEQWKDRDTRIEDKWSIAKWDGESFEELNEMYRIEEVIEIGEQIPSKEELTCLRSELQQEREKVKELTDELLELRKFDER